MSNLRAQRGVSFMEIVIVVAIVLILAGLAIPVILQTVYNLRLRSAGGDLSGLMQEARSLAAKQNTTYAIKFSTLSGARIAYIDINSNGVYDAAEPLVQFIGTVAPAAGLPTGSGGQPSPYVLVGDSGAGAYDNTNAVAYSPRGLPCNYDTPPTCSTPAAKYFVYYLTDTRSVGVSGWAAVVVTKGGRAKVVTWNGAAWR
jgi:prepilin-type N-terminal cleavage/methylation domain-containing protein